MFASYRAAGNGSDRIRWMKQGAVVGCAVEALSAAEAAEAEQGQRSVFCKGATTPEAKSREPQPGAALRFLQAPFLARRKNRLSARGTNAGNEPERNGFVELSEIQKLDGTH